DAMKARLASVEATSASSATAAIAEMAGVARARDAAQAQVQQLQPQGEQRRSQLQSGGGGGGGGAAPAYGGGGDGGGSGGFYGGGGYVDLSDVALKPELWHNIPVQQLMLLPQAIRNKFQETLKTGLVQYKDMPRATAAIEPLARLAQDSLMFLADLRGHEGQWMRSPVLTTAMRLLESAAGVYAAKSPVISEAKFVAGVAAQAFSQSSAVGELLRASVATTAETAKALRGGRSTSPAKKGGGGGKVPGKCNNCNKVGHKAADCRSGASSSSKNGGGAAAGH
ncbi:MAG: C2HC-type zinc finger protein, partial [Pseudomonadota bacterium]